MGKDDIATPTNDERRPFLGREFLNLAANELAAWTMAKAQSIPSGASTPGANTSLGALKHVDVGGLRAGHAEAGPSSGPLVILLHGWPYDIYTYVDVPLLLATSGYRVLVPSLHGYGNIRLLLGTTPRNSLPIAIASNITFG